MDADRLLDPVTPESEVDAELRAMGLDPERVALTGQVAFLRARAETLEEDLASLRRTISRAAYEFEHEDGRVCVTSQQIVAWIDRTSAQIDAQAPLIDALLATDRQELPRPLAMLVDAYVKACDAREHG